MLVSIIIPIYNVAPYIGQCLKSVMAQSYRNLEVLLIDDCGTDDSIDIARGTIGGEDSIIEGITYRILHHEHNRGLSAARNTGIDAAKGEWVYFLDSDDWITPDCIETLVTSTKDVQDIDIVMSDYSASNGKRAGGQFLMGKGIYSDNLIHRYLARDYNIPVWNKLVKRDFIITNNLYFKEGLIHEDFLWSFCAACRIRKFAYTGKVTYYYLIREMSLDHIPDTRIHELHYGIAHTLISDFVCKDKNLKKNTEIYQWLEKERFTRFMTPGWNQHVDVFQQLYQQIRNTKYYTIVDLLSFRQSLVTKGALRRSLHTFLPYRYGYSWYVKTYNKYGI